MPLERYDSNDAVPLGDLDTMELIDEVRTRYMDLNSDCSAAFQHAADAQTRNRHLEAEIATLDQEILALRARLAAALET